MKFLIGILFLPLFSLGQVIYKGNVTDSKTKQAIPFASVALSKENIGTNADEEGNFFLESWRNLLADSLVISCVGYKLKVIPITESRYYNIELEERSIQLEQVNIISKEKWNVERLNILSECGNIGITTDGSHTQVAKYFSSSFPNAILTEIEICKKKYFSSRKAKFRIRIYDIDTVTRAPSVDLCDEVIEVNSSKKSIILNLEKYKIHIPSKHFFVAVEWLKIPENVNKYKITDQNGKEEDKITYRPSIGGQLLENYNLDKSKMLFEVWQLNYQNTWVPMRPFSNISIIATVKY